MIRVSVDTTQHLVTVTYDDGKTSIGQMKTALANDGYPAQDAKFHTDITPNEAKYLMDTDSSLMILDVREAGEFQGGHISGAINYPWNSGILAQEYGKLSADTTVLVVCASGKRSNPAAEFLVSAGFTKVYDMIGGMNNMIIPVNYTDIGHIGSDLNIAVPCARYHGNQYRFVLNDSPSSSGSPIWKMDGTSFEQIVVPGNCLSVGDDLRLNLNGEYDSIKYSFAMDYAANPDDPFVWEIDVITPVEAY
ncbi:MAG: hypothetical protein HC887_06620 [Desulfobacteraceae bacterium]|nr:hypothetical protein [Desulfobacteraceae bacterium]